MDDATGEAEETGLRVAFDRRLKLARRLPLHESAPLATGLVVLFVIAQRQTDQLTRLVDDLLDVARVTQGRIILRKVRLKGIVEGALERGCPR